MASTIVTKSAMMWRPHIESVCGLYRVFSTAPSVISRYVSKSTGCNNHHHHYNNYSNYYCNCVVVRSQQQHQRKDYLFPAMTRLELFNQKRLFCSEAETADDEEMEKTASPNDPKAYNPVDVHTSIRYMESEAYQQAYGEEPVWFHYRPNHPGGKPRVVTRKTCVRAGKYSAGNPCPICRDNHLILDYRNVKLLKQFLTTNELTIFEPYRTQICMTQNRKLLIALEKAKQMGLIEYKDLEFRTYDYTQYYKSLQSQLLLNPPDETNERSFAHRVLRKEVEA